MSRGIETIIGITSSEYSTKTVFNVNGHVLKSVNYETFVLPDGTKPLAGVDMGGHQTANLISINVKNMFRSDRNLYRYEKPTPKLFRFDSWRTSKLAIIIKLVKNLKNFAK